MNKKFNVAIVGSGAIANKFHIPAFKKNKKIKDVILFDFDKKNLLKSSKKNKIKYIYTNFEKMINEKKIDI
jgi:predicted dehydrogenase